MECKTMPSCYLAYRLAKLKPKTENCEGNTQRRLSLDLGCNAIADAVAAAWAYKLELTDHGNI
jgi:hypothetical protein